MALLCQVVVEVTCRHSPVEVVVVEDESWKHHQGPARVAVSEVYGAYLDSVAVALEEAREEPQEDHRRQQAEGGDREGSC